MATKQKEESPNLSDEDDVGHSLADAAAAIVTDEAETSDARGADVPVTTGAVSNPFQIVSTNRTAVVHLRFLIMFSETLIAQPMDWEIDAVEKRIKITNLGFIFAQRELNQIYSRQ